MSEAEKKYREDRIKALASISHIPSEELRKAAEKQYYDIDGNKVSLDRLCELEPQWAASRIRHMTLALAATEQSESNSMRGLTKFEQETLHNALRKSVKITKPPKHEPLSDEVRIKIINECVSNDGCYNMPKLIDMVEKAVKGEE